MVDRIRPKYFPSHDRDPDEQYRLRRRLYAQTVSIVCLGVLVVAFVTATVCGVVNVLSGKH